MEIKNIQLKSGETYTLSQLFSGSNKIIIPDLQRDYCWGSRAWNSEAETYAELVSGFVGNLISAFNNEPNKPITLGLIYGYETPKSHIQLCDGQQRITTLFLLLGVINRGTISSELEYGKFKRYLISDFELNNDDKEPNLQYAIRESTLYFLSDLVCEYFLKSSLKTAEIKNQNWYFNEYELDASIQSMLAALKTIEEKLAGVDIPGFGKFITEYLEMIYYDMGGRTQGEETFVVINTTGEPLTATENLKPIIIGNILEKAVRDKYSNQWEQREDWFWQNRGDDPTSDGGMNTFFVWYWQMRLLQERSWKNKKPYDINPLELFTVRPNKGGDGEENPEIEQWEESIKSDTIHSYYCALTLLVERSKEEKIAAVLRTIEDKDINFDWYRKTSLDVVLPLIAYCEKFKKPEHLYEFVRRLRRNHFDEKRERGGVVDWRHIIQVINMAPDELSVLSFDTIAALESFKKIPNVELHQWYGDEQKWKRELMTINQQRVYEWEDHKEFYGDLSVLFEINQNQSIDFQRVESQFGNFVLLVNCLNEAESRNHKILSNYVRLYRLLLGYPKIGHIDYCSWDIEGAWFSWSNYNNKNYFKILKDREYISLLNCDKKKLLVEVKHRVKQIAVDKELFTLNQENFTASKHLTLWIILKVLGAEREDYLLPFYDGKGIAAYTEADRNRLSSDLEFSIANSICGYAVKSPSNRISYADQDVFNQSNYFDTPLSSKVTYEMYHKSEGQNIEISIINIVNEYINKLIDEFINSKA